MKIALIRKNYSSYGGAENYLRLVAKGLNAKGHDVHIFSASNWHDNAFSVHRIKTLNKPSFLSNIFFAVNSKAVLKKESFDCIISFERTFFQDIYRAGDGCHREWLNKRRMIEPFLKKLSFSLNPHHLVVFYLEKRCFSKSKKIIANSMMVKNDIIKHYSIPDRKIHVIYNGVDLNRFRPVTAEQKTIAKHSLGIRENKVILFVGADFKRKGLTVLLKAGSLLDMKDKKLIVVGKKETPQYFKMAKKLRIEKHVIFWGHEPEIEKFLIIADVFVLPTIYDPFSNAALEAMATGLPVVTTAYNGASELIENGVNGFIISDPLDERAFADKISTALLKAEEIGKNARTKAEDYSIEKAVDSIIKVILGHGK